MTRGDDGEVLVRFESGDRELLDEIASLFNKGTPVSYDGSIHIGKEITDYSEYEEHEGILPNG